VPPKKRGLGDHLEGLIEWRRGGRSVCPFSLRSPHARLPISRTPVHPPPPLQPAHNLPVVGLTNFMRSKSRVGHSRHLGFQCQTSLPTGLRYSVSSIITRLSLREPRLDALIVPGRKCLRFNDIDDMAAAFCDRAHRDRVFPERFLPWREGSLGCGLDSCRDPLRRDLPRALSPEFPPLWLHCCDLVGRGGTARTFMGKVEGAGRRQLPPQIPRHRAANSPKKPKRSEGDR